MVSLLPSPLSLDASQPLKPAVDAVPELEGERSPWLPSCRSACRNGFNSRCRRFWNQICTERGLIPSCAASACRLSKLGSGSSSAEQERRQRRMAQRRNMPAKTRPSGAQLCARAGQITLQQSHTRRRVCPESQAERAGAPKYCISTSSWGLDILHRLNFGTLPSRGEVAIASIAVDSSTSLQNSQGRPGWLVIGAQPHLNLGSQSELGSDSSNFGEERGILAFFILTWYGRFASGDRSGHAGRGNIARPTAQAGPTAGANTASHAAMHKFESGIM